VVPVRTSERGAGIEELSTWGLTAGDRRFLWISLTVMAALLIAQGYQQARRSAFQVRVVRPTDAPMSPTSQSTGLSPASAIPERQPEPARTEPVQTKFLVDINSADWHTWRLLDGIGETLARRIVNDRNSRGPFTSIDDISRVKGIGPKTLAKMRPHLKLTEPPR